MKPKRVGYDITHALICEEHFEFGPLLCCPFPGCPNGTDTDQIEAAPPPGLESKTYRRRVWTLADGELSYSWGGDLPQWFSIQRVFTREATRRWLYRPTAPVIYHYTSAEGVLGIIQTGVIWMSDYSYLNDAAELTYGLEIAMERLKEAAQTRSSAKDVLNRWAEDPTSLSCRVCVASFSSDGDSLSQWRAYGPIAAGFLPDSLGFGHASSVATRPVIYDPAAQCQLLDLLAHLCASAYEEDQGSRPDRVSSLYASGADMLLNVIAFLKHPAFADEREVRMVYIENPKIYDNIQIDRAPQRFRVAGGLVVPYVTTRDVASHYPAKLPLHEVVIGPSRHADTLKRGVEELLSTRDYACVEVRRSSAPLRS